MGKWIPPHVAQAQYKAQHKFKGQAWKKMDYTLPKPPPAASYVEWETHTISTEPPINYYPQDGHYWWLDWQDEDKGAAGYHPASSWEGYEAVTLVDPASGHAYIDKHALWVGVDMASVHDDLMAINTFLSSYKSSTQMGGTIKYTSHPTKVFPVEGTYAIDGGNLGTISVTIHDSPQDSSVLAMVKIPVVAIVNLNHITTWLKQAITVGAKAATASVTTIDAFDRLLDDEQYRDVLKAILRAHLKANPQDALDLGLKRALDQESLGEL